MNKILGSFGCASLFLPLAEKCRHVFFKVYLTTVPEKNVTNPESSDKPAPLEHVKNNDKRTPHQNRGCRCSCLQRLFDALALHVVKRFCCRCRQQISLAVKHERGY